MIGEGTLSYQYQCPPCFYTSSAHQELVCFALKRIHLMTLIIIQVVSQTVSSTLHWLGLCFGIRTWAGPNPHRWPWLVITTIVSAAWLLAIMLLAANNFFGNDGLPPRIPMAMVLTLAFGYLLLLSTSFRGIIASIPQHWLIGIQTFRILGGVFIVRYLQGEIPAFFAIPAGVGDVLTGIFAPLVAYWLYSGKSYARGAAIAWNLFGMADLVDAVAIGVTTGGPGIVFPIVLIPIYAVPRAFLIHSYSLIGLLRKTSRTSQGEALHYDVA